MKVGFTGTREGMTLDQRSTFREVVKHINCFVEFHHGDCVGSDDEAHHMIKEVRPSVKVIIHPPLDDKHRAYCKGGKLLPVKDYLSRNHDIVDSVDWLIATPKEEGEVLRSGTWATIRYARKAGKRVTIIRPNGRVYG